jgi:hypothetical protein
LTASLPSPRAHPPVHSTKPLRFLDQIATFLAEGIDPPRQCITGSLLPFPLRQTLTVDLDTLEATGSN